MQFFTPNNASFAQGQTAKPNSVNNVRPPLTISEWIAKKQKSELSCSSADIVILPSVIEILIETALLPFKIFAIHKNANPLQKMHAPKF